MLSWILITHRPTIARIAFDAGVSRIMVDLETHGKRERQGHLDTVISEHTLEDAAAIRQAVPAAEVLVRVNPLHPSTPAEVEGAIAADADLIMLPMFLHVREVRELARLVDGRAGLVPLLETPDAIDIAAEVAAVPGVVELYVGLNDLHLALGLPFIFQPLADGMVDGVAMAAKDAGRRLGFGGIARVGEGLVPGEMVLAEHLRLGSDCVILSRTFFRHDGCESETEASTAFCKELALLRDAEERLKRRTETEIQSDHEAFVHRVNAIARQRSRRDP